MLEGLAECIYKHRADEIKPILLLGEGCSRFSSCPSQGYWFLAELIKKGYFDLVLTTCSDNCLEKALVMTMDYDDFKIIYRGEVSDKTISGMLKVSRPPRVKIVKLRGECRANNLATKSSKPLEITKTLKENLIRIARERGIIGVGNSEMGNFLLSDIPADENQKKWNVDGTEGEFDSLFISLSRIIGIKEQENSEHLKQLQELLKSETIGEQSSIFNEFIPDRHFNLLPRPWGSVFSMVENEKVSVKILYLNPGEALSFHKHNVRDEIFLVLDKQVQLQIGCKKILLERGNSFRVPAGMKHRLTGLNVPCRILEISRNYYSQEEDIDRFEDKYGRVGAKGDE